MVTIKCPICGVPNIGVPHRPGCLYEYKPQAVTRGSIPHVVAASEPMALVPESAARLAVDALIAAEANSRIDAKRADGFATIQRGHEGLAKRYHAAATAIRAALKGE